MRNYLLIFLSLLTLHASAQSPIRKAQNSFDDAQQFVRQNIFDEALKNLDAAVKADPKFQLAYIQLGVLYKRLKDNEKAKESFRQAVNVAPVSDPVLYFTLGELELQTGDYVASKKTLSVFLEKENKATEFTEKAKKYQTDCDFAIEAVKKPVPYKPVNMGFYINSEYRDYFPALTADGQTLIFTRNIRGNEDFYVSEKKNNEWQQAQPLSDNINTPNFNEGAQSLSPDGKYLFFTGCNRPDGLGRCDIYISKKTGNGWSKPLNLGKPVNSEHWESQPAISPDGNTLYFVSNRTGGFGGYDIWKSTLQDDGNWTEPVNLGPNINTPYDEVTPFMHVDGKTLYFSSDGWPGFGQKDIYYSRLQDDGSFSKPINLGYPINTFNDETGFIVAADGKEGYFSADLGGGFGNVDIYKLELPQNIKPLPVTYVKGVVKDKQTLKTLEASVLIVNLKTNSATYNEYTNAETGDFMAVMPINQEYAFNILADGYLMYSHHFNIKNDDANKPVNFEILLDKITVGADVTLNNIFFDTNKYELLPPSLIELNLLAEVLKSNPTLIIEIQGHTDNVGDLKTNQKLSENRAKSVYDYLINNGINSKQLTYKGYGENVPKFNNDTEEGRSENRRTEFKVIKI
ncbi:OmpA family protein [Pedobacter montanisoli]|uniref:OmpA family protein n=1 Tax=Pedobacter montanisoli TaxID=2923277 RepID=A0ABS9ZY53_9SPHI|nr:OmpA family protein [Pedobacter montanisoli]MCJ0743212.1 OmpA family protein [Pedobacter montanisoli]